MDNRTIVPAVDKSQDSPLEKFITDLRGLRRKMVTSERFHRSGVLAGELLILATHYQDGRPVSARRLKRFLHFIVERAA